MADRWGINQLIHFCQFELLIPITRSTLLEKNLNPTWHQYFRNLFHKKKCYLHHVYRTFLVVVSLLVLIIIIIHLSVKPAPEILFQLSWHWHLTYYEWVRLRFSESEYKFNYTVYEEVRLADQTIYHWYEWPKIFNITFMYKDGSAYNCNTKYVYVILMICWFSPIRFVFSCYAIMDTSISITIETTDYKIWSNKPKLTFWNGTLERLWTPLRQTFSYGIRHIFIVIHWKMSHSSLNNNENMPYPVWKSLPYGSSQPPYYFNIPKVPLG